MARILGYYEKPWCPGCHVPSGIDCGNKAKSKKAMKAKEKREWHSKAVEELELDELYSVHDR